MAEDFDPLAAFVRFIQEQLLDSAALIEIFLTKPLSTMYKVGQRIRGEYEVRGVYGGGNGVVLTTWNHRHRRSYALKTLREDLLLLPDAKDAFEKECRLWISLGKHPFVLPAYFTPYMSGRLFVAIECIEPDKDGAITMEDHIRKGGGLPVEDVATWAIQICLGMEYANAKGIVCHRDLKPRNILIDRNRCARVTDFGIVKTREFAVPGRTYLAGTLPYIPPETLERSASSDVRRDIWSTGVTLYEATAGRPPWFVPSHDPHEWSRCIVARRPAALQSPLWPVIEKCLEVDRARRYGAFEILRHDLEAIYRNLTGRDFSVPRAPDETAEDLLNRAFSFQQLGAVNEAIGLYRKALDVDSEPFTRGRIYHNLGRAHMSRGDLDEAEKNMEQATVVDPSLDRPWIDWARICEQKGDRPKTLGLLGQASQYGDAFVDVWLAHGEVSERTGEWSHALQCFERAGEIDPTDSQALCGKAKCLFMLGRKPEARDALRKCIAMDPQRFGLSFRSS